MSDSGPKSKRRKTGKFYKKQQYLGRNRQKFLEPGLKGFMVTCNYREKDCVRECYNLLNEYASPIEEKQQTVGEAVAHENNGLKKSDTNALQNKENSDVTNDEQKVPENINEVAVDKVANIPETLTDVPTETKTESPENGKINESVNPATTSENTANQEDDAGNDDEDDDDGDDDTDDSDEEQEEDISTQLENQVKNMNDPKLLNIKRFKQIDTKTMNCLFINCPMDDPMELGLKIVRDIAATKIHKSRYILRFLPVEIICKATLEDIKNAAGTLLDKYFLNTEPKTFSVVVNKRFNNSVERMKIIRELAEMITFKNVLHKVNLRNPQLSVIVEVNKGLCCLAVLPDYMQLRKYNLTELVKVEKNGSAADDEAEVTAVAAAEE